MTTPHVPVPVDVALRIAAARATAHGYDLVLPGDPRREAVVLGLGAVHALTGDGWSLEHARSHTSVTLPGAGDAVTEALAAVPLVGSILGAVARTVSRPIVLLSPSAVADGATLLAVLRHEEGHVGQIRRGTLPWCLAYGVVPEVRAAAEGQCYVSSLVVEHALGRATARQLYDGALESLRAYGLGDDIALAEGVLRGALVSLDAGGDPGGLGAEVLAELRAEGVL